jgi:Ca-activated chloride channel homolog
VLPAGLHLGFPWALLALPLLLLLPRRPWWWLRALGLALLVLALTQPSLPRAGGRLALLVDVSDSVGSGALQAARALVRRGAAARPEVFYLASDTARVPTLGADVPSVLNTGSTDLARALQVAAASGARRALLISDGVQSRGHVLDALPDIPVDTLAVGRRPNVRLSRLLAPDQAAPGQNAQVVAVIDSDRNASVTLQPSVDGRLLAPITRELPKGRHAIPFSFQVGGKASSVTVDASISADFPQPSGDDRQQTEITVRSRPPVLVIGDPALSRLLRAQGIEVQDGTVADVKAPMEASAVVVRGSAAQFTTGQLQLLKQYVENGGGLWMTGGPHSFGLGGWYRTPVEDVLPVTTDVRTKVSLPQVAMVIVLDHSQSMSAGSPSKLELAKQGAVKVVELAYQDDLIGLIAFSDPSSTNWVFHLRKATERGKRVMLQGILGITTAGGTVLGPAYRDALDALQQTRASVKHIIILSDGKLYDGQGPFNSGPVTDFGALAAQGRAEGITTSTIAIGASADFQRLAAIARAGGGRYYQALDVNTLPSIFTSEALTATRKLLVQEPTAPQPRPNALLQFPATLPQVEAYVATSLRPTAQELLAGKHDEPILAIRHVGLGRTAALTTDLNQWAGPFGGWSGLPGDLATLTRWLQARPLVYQARATRDGGGLQVVVDAVKGGAYVNNKSLTVRFDGHAAAMEQVAPGRYQARLPYRAGSSGSVVVSEGSEVVARARVGGPDPEFADTGGPSLLAEISRRTGGRVITPGAPYAPAVGGGTLPLWPPIAAAALALFLLELLARRLWGSPQRTSPNRRPRTPEAGTGS